MTTASKITLVRVLLIPVFMVFLYASGGSSNLWMWLALGIFVIASLTDFVDGQIARKCNRSVISENSWILWRTSCW